MDNCNEDTIAYSPFIICPICKTNIPIMSSLQYSQNSPNPIIIIQCQCSSQPISLSSIAILYSNKASNSIPLTDIQDKKYIQFTRLVNDLVELFTNINKFLDLSSLDNKVMNKYKLEIISMEKKFYLIFNEISELYQKIIFDSMNQNCNYINAMNNYHVFTFQSLHKYRSLLVCLFDEFKQTDKKQPFRINHYLQDISHIDNNFILLQPTESNIRTTKHLYCSLGRMKVVVKWKTNHYAKAIHFPIKHIDSVECVCELHNGNIVTCGYDSIIQIWDRSKQTVIRVLKGHLRPVLTVIQLQNGLIASGSSDESIRLWDINQEKCVKELKGHAGNVVKLMQLSNKLLVSCSADTSICLWDLEINENYYLRGHEFTVQSADELKDNDVLTDANSNIDNDDGIRLASCSIDRKIIIWNIKERSIIKTLTNDDIVQPLLCIIKLKDDNILAGSQNQMYIWNWKAGELLKVIRSGAYCFVQLLNDYIATGSNDTRVKIYSYPEMELVTALSAHENTVISIASLTDGNIISSSWDGSFKIWR